MRLAHYKSKRDLGSSLCSLSLLLLCFGMLPALSLTDGAVLGCAPAFGCPSRPGDRYRSLFGSLDWCR